MGIWGWLSLVDENGQSWYVGHGGMMAFLFLCPPFGHPRQRLWEFRASLTKLYSDTSWTSSFPKASWCRWEEYRDTSGRSTECTSLSARLRAPKVLQYKLEVYCKEVYYSTYFSENRRRTNVQQLTCKIDLSSSFFLSFLLFCSPGAKTPCF